MKVVLTMCVNPSEVFIAQQNPPSGSPEHLDLLRRVPLTLGLAGLDRPDRLWSVMEAEVWPEGEELADRSPRTDTTAGLGSRRPGPVLSWS